MDADVMARVTAAVQRGRAGKRADARRELEAVWAEVERGGGDDFHRCVIAHFLVDLQDDGRAELMWDERALAAVAGVSDDRAGVRRAAAGPGVHAVAVPQPRRRPPATR